MEKDDFLVRHGDAGETRAGFSFPPHWRAGGGPQIGQGLLLGVPTPMGAEDLGPFAGGARGRDPKEQRESDQWALMRHARSSVSGLGGEPSVILAPLGRGGNGFLEIREPRDGPNAAHAHADVAWCPG